MGRLSLIIVLGIVALFGVLAGGAAVAATGWRVFATSSDSGDYGAFATANATVSHPRAVAVRALSSSSQPLEVRWSLLCNGVASIRSGAVVIASVPASVSCMVDGSATGGPGRVTVQLLRR